MSEKKKSGCFGKLLKLVLWGVVGLVVLTVLLAGTAFFEGGALTEGFLASHSRIVHAAATVLEARLEGSSK